MKHLSLMPPDKTSVLEIGEEVDTYHGNAIEIAQQRSVYVCVKQGVCMGRVVSYVLVINTVEHLKAGLRQRTREKTARTY